jgi:hypothetical protein
VPDFAFRQVVESSPLPIFFLGLDGRYLFLNRESLRLHGLSGAEAMIARHFAELLPPGERPEASEAWARLLARGSDVTSMPLPQGNPPGRVVLARQVVSNRAGDGEVVAAVARGVNLLDAGQSRDSAVEQETLTSRIYRQMSLKVWTLDLNDHGPPRYSYANERLQAAIGRPLSEIVGRSVEDVGLARSEQQNQVLQELYRRCQETGQRVFGQVELSLQDERAWVRVQVDPILAEGGRASGLVCVGIRIDDLMQVDAEIRREKEMLEKLVAERTEQVIALERHQAEAERHAAVGRIAARIAHEINNPLAGIRNCAILVGSTLPTDHPYARHLSGMLREIDRVAEIVRRTSDLYLLESHPPQRTPVDPAIEDVVSLLETRAHEAGVRIEVVPAEPGLIVPMIEGELHQVLLNILINAIEVSPAGASVRVVARSEGAQVEIRIEDQGPGIPEAHRTRIFEPFFTTRTGSGSASGIGLGLSVSLSLVHAAGGNLRLDSTAEKGSTFRILLPAAAAVEGANP